MKEKLGLIGGILTVAGLICDLAKGLLEDKKQEALIEEKVNKKFEEKRKEEKGS